MCKHKIILLVYIRENIDHNQFFVAKWWYGG